MSLDLVGRPAGSKEYIPKPAMFKQWWNTHTMIETTDCNWRYLDLPSGKLTVRPCQSSGLEDEWNSETTQNWVTFRVNSLVSAWSLFWPCEVAKMCPDWYTPASECSIWLIDSFKCHVCLWSKCDGASIFIVNARLQATKSTMSNARISSVVPSQWLVNREFP